MQKIKVALVHDKLTEYGGAERVLEALHEIFPKAPIYTSILDLESLGPHAQRIKKWDIRTSWFQKLPFSKKLVSPFRIFAPLMFESFDLSEYDLVISSTNAYFAKAVITKPESLHIAYIHTPPRYLYGYVTKFDYKKNIFIRIFAAVSSHFLRIFDFETSQRPDILVANSKNIAERIKKFYRRESVIIYPPVDTVIPGTLSSSRKRGSKKILDRVENDNGKPGMTNSKGYFLTVNRLDRVKRVDVIIEAVNRLGINLKVIGTGREMGDLKKIAGRNIEFLGEVGDEELVKFYAGAKATIVAAEDEDFGIVPLESMAAGIPVIAPGAGGFLETVVDGKTGILYIGDSEQVTVDSLVEAIRNFDSKNFNVEDLRKHAEKFSKERFKKEILELIDKNLKRS